MQIWKKRVYDEPAKQDGLRVLVDRIWPRGVTKKDARIDLWLKDIAPSNDLRKWFDHDPEKWKQFKKNYFKELDFRPEEVEKLTELLDGRRITLVYSAKDEDYNNAEALKQYLKKRYND
jgi:uncharacterized protein YeaO (DUF488 family)